MFGQRRFGDQSRRPIESTRGSDITGIQTPSSESTGRRWKVSFGGSDEGAWPPIGRGALTCAGPPAGGAVRVAIPGAGAHEAISVRTQIAQATTRHAPSALPASKGLIAYWNFNDAKAVAVPVTNLKAARQANGKVKVTFDGTGAIQTSATVGGTYADSTIKSGDEIATDGAALFLRAKK